MKTKQLFKREHYFFRQGSQNSIFKENFEYRTDGYLVDRLAGLNTNDFELVKSKKKVSDEPPPIKYKLKNFEKMKPIKVEEIFLAIYYSNDFTAKEYDLNSKDYWEKIKTKYRSAVKEFFNAEVGSIFWIFIDQHVLAFEATSKTFDHKDPTLDEKTLTRASVFALFDPVSPKLRKFNFKNRFDRTKIPEIFATTDSSNIQGTILNLSRTNKKDADDFKSDRHENALIAENLIEGSKIKIESRLDLLTYLSPIQLETFFFKYFDSQEFYVSSCRGGSKFKIDLFVLPEEGSEGTKFFKMDENGIKLQIKRSHSKSNAQDYLNDPANAGIYMVCLNSIEGFDSPFLIDKKKLEVYLSDKSFDVATEWAKAILEYSQVFDFEMN